LEEEDKMAESPIMGAVEKFSIGGNILTYIWYITIAIIVLGIMGAIFYVLWRNKQFKYKVHILEELGDGGTRIYHDRGRIIKREDGTRIFRLKMFKDTTLQIPELDSMMIGDKGSKEVFLKKFGINEFDFVPLGIHLKALSVDVKPFPQGRKNWISTELKRSAQRHGTFWDKYGQIITTVGVLTLAFIMVIVIFKMAQEIAASVQGVAGVLTQAMDRMAASCGAPLPASVPTPGF